MTSENSSKMTCRAASIPSTLNTSRISLLTAFVVDIVHGENVHKITPYRVQNPDVLGDILPVLLLTAFWIFGRTRLKCPTRRAIRYCLATCPENSSTDKSRRSDPATSTPRFFVLLNTFEFNRSLNMSCPCCSR
jgi:hypothetical protein